MHKKWLISLFACSIAASAAGQTPPAAPTLELSVDQAVRMALDNNVDLTAARLEPQIGDTNVAVAAGAFKPVFSSSLQRNNQLAPPSNFLFPIATRTDIVTSQVGLNHRLERFG